MSNPKTTKSINLQKTECPICQNKGNYTTDFETYCNKCGCIITTPYPYTAGIKHKTLTEY